VTLHPIQTGRPGRASNALIRRALGDSRIRTIAFAYVFGVYAWLQAAGYRSAYPTLADRMSFARAFAGNDAIRLFYGYPYDVFTVGGYSAWRVGGTLAIAGVAFGMLASIRALRTEEEVGRADTVLATPISRRTWHGSELAACAAPAFVLWLAEWVGFVVGRLPLAGAAFLALSTVSVVVVFVGVGALASQLASTGHGALGLSAGVGVACWLGRVVSDTLPGAGWLRWATPLGWAEASRPFAGTHLAVLALPLVATGALIAVSLWIARGRDVGVGLLSGRSETPPRLHLLRTSTTHAIRSQRWTFLGWVVGVCGSAAVLGMISTSISAAGLSKKLQIELDRLGAGSITTPAGYLALIFVVFVVAICLFGCAQVGSVCKEELGHQLETLFALPIGRVRWLGGRLLVILVGVVVLGELAGLLTWVGAASQGVRIPLSHLLEAGWNCATVAVLFLGLAALAYAVVPRAATAISYLLVSVSFLWYILGVLLRLPRWLLDATPFQHVGLEPAEPFQTVAAGALVLIGLTAGVAALAVFRRRDLDA
jgi:ABC-2 type transport system permease protein